MTSMCWAKIAMMPTMSFVRTSAAACLLAIILSATAQQGSKMPIPTAVGPVTMVAGLGSFKLLGHSDEDPARGHLEVNFNGTVLISGLVTGGHVTPSGAIHLEYSNDAHKRQSYFGTGKLIIDGTVRSVQCFGSDIKVSFVGRGLFRISGEFDKTGKTGNYWFGAPTDLKAERKPWGTFGTQIEVPEVHYGPAKDIVPTPRKGG
jgi:hypothetical protein